MNYESFFEYLKKINHPVLQSLKKGLTDREIKDLETKFNISLPDYLKKLYKLYNGVETTEDKTIGELSIFSNGIFLSLEDALETLSYNNEEGYWKKTYFPVFTSGGGDYLLIQLAPESDLNRIYFYCPSSVDFETIISIYDNLETLITSVIKCYESGVYFIENGMMEMVSDPYAEAKRSKPLNPLSEYWKLFSV